MHSNTADTISLFFLIFWGRIGGSLEHFMDACGENTAVKSQHENARSHVTDEASGVLSISGDNSFLTLLEESAADDCVHLPLKCEQEMIQIN